MVIKTIQFGPRRNDELVKNRAKSDWGAILVGSKVEQHRPRCASAYSLELVERRRMSQSVQTFVRRETRLRYLFY